MSHTKRAGLYKSKRACQTRKLFESRKDLLNVYDMYDPVSSRDDYMAFIKQNYTEPISHPSTRKNKKIIDFEFFNESFDKKFSNRHYTGKINIEDILRTFKYIYYRHKRGVYVSIRNNKLKVFLHFNNNGYVNPLRKYLEKTPRTSIQKNITDKLKENPDADVSKISINDPGKWLTVNCLVHAVTRNPPGAENGYEPEFNYREYLMFLRTLCATRKIEDCDFFLNYFDQMILRDNLSIPFYHITGKKDIPIEEYQNKRMVPILSTSTSKDFLDLPFVLPDDIARTYKIFGAPRCSNSYDDKFNLDWSTKKEMGVFRGSSTGCGWTVETNHRLGLYHVGQKNKDVLDVALTAPNLLHFKKHVSDPHVKFFQDERIKETPEKMMSLLEQSNYKYLIYVEGNVLAYRLSSMFGMKSVVIYVESEYHPYYYSLLVDKQNCLRVKSVKDIPNLIRWCKNHDKQCQEIAENGYATYKKYFSKKGILDYAKYLLNRVSSSER